MLPPPRLFFFLLNGLFIIWFGIKEIFFFLNYTVLRELIYSVNFSYPTWRKSAMLRSLLAFLCSFLALFFPEFWGKFKTVRKVGRIVQWTLISPTLIQQLLTFCQLLYSLCIYTHMYVYMCVCVCEWNFFLMFSK